MTLTAREVVYSIFGAYRLAMLDKTGLNYLDRSPEGAIRSFNAALIVLPAYAVLVVLRLWDVLPDVSLLRFVTVEGLAYVISWTAFPLAMFHISGLLDRSERYFDFLSAYNWSSVIQMGVYLPVVAVEPEPAAEPEEPEDAGVAIDEDVEQLASLTEQVIYEAEAIAGEAAHNFQVAFKAVTDAQSAVPALSGINTYLHRSVRINAQFVEEFAGVRSPVDLVNLQVRFLEQHRLAMLEFTQSWTSRKSVA